MVEVTFDFVFDLEVISGIFGVLKLSPEFIMKTLFGEVCDVGKHARHRQAFVRLLFSVIIAAAKMRIAHD